MRNMVNRGSIFLEWEHLSTGATWYLLRSCHGTVCKVLLEIEVQQDGGCVDYRKLDEFWGRVPRPLL